MRSYTIERVRGYSKEYDVYDFSVVRVHPKMLEDLGGRGAWTVITPEDDPNKRVFRQAKGCGGETGFTQRTIQLDYEARSYLQIENKKDGDEYYQCSLVLRQANLHEYILAHWTHPNPGYRISFKLAVLSLVLGTIGLILGVISLMQ